MMRQEVKVMEDFLSSRSGIQSVIGLHCTNVVEASQGNDTPG